MYESMLSRSLLKTTVSAAKQIEKSIHTKQFNDVFKVFDKSEYERLHLHGAGTPLQRTNR